MNKARAVNLPTCTQCGHQDINLKAVAQFDRVTCEWKIRYTYPNQAWCPKCKKDIKDNWSWQDIEVKA